MSRAVSWGVQRAQPSWTSRKKIIAQYPTPTQTRKINMFHVSISK